MYYTVYKIINLINNKVYIGIHRTDNLEDSYMGSGQNIKRAIRKYGRENFKKEYLAVFDNIEEMLEMETKLVNREFLDSGLSYNLNEGGKAGFTYLDPQIMKKKFSEWGSWKDLEKRQRVWKSVPLEKRKEIGKQMGTNHGGSNRLSEVEINKRIEVLKTLDSNAIGYIMTASRLLDITHTQVRRFIDKYYNVSSVL